MKLQKVAVVSKVGSKESEKAVKDVAKKLLAKKSTVYTITSSDIEGTKKIETLEELKKIKLDLVISLGGDGTTLRVFRNLDNEVPILTINVGGNRGILSEITLGDVDTAIKQILAGKVFLDKRTRVVASCGKEEFPPALNEIFIKLCHKTNYHLQHHMPSLQLPQRVMEKYCQAILRPLKLFAKLQLFQYKI